MRRTTENGNTGIRWKFMSKLEDLDFADDIIALLSSTQQHAAQVKATRLNKYAAQTGLRINKKKTEVLRINSKCNTRIQIDDQHLNEVEKGLLLTSKEMVRKTQGTEFVKQGQYS